MVSNNETATRVSLNILVWNEHNLYEYLVKYGDVLQFGKSGLCWEEGSFGELIRIKSVRLKH